MAGIGAATIRVCMPPPIRMSDQATWAVRLVAAVAAQLAIAPAQLPACNAETVTHRVEPGARLKDSKLRPARVQTDSLEGS